MIDKRKRDNLAFFDRARWKAEKSEGENEMKKILNRLFVIASLGLIVAGAIFLCVSIFDGNETTTPLAAALACILLSNLFHVIRMNLDKK